VWLKWYPSTVKNLENKKPKKKNRHVKKCILGTVRKSWWISVINYNLKLHMAVKFFPFQIMDVPGDGQLFHPHFLQEAAPCEGLCAMMIPT
jgi:hypothetical protein